METEFTPWASLAGGALIGLAAVLLMCLHGRIMGATGIVSGLLRVDHPADWALRAALLVGMLSGPLAMLLLTGSMPAIDVPVSRAMLVVGGIVVGIGASLGSGCTSGHGVCGLARFSPRSAAATATFMGATFVTVFIVRHVVG